jgi:NADH-quinone oxidoreductase subunit H
MMSFFILLVLAFVVFNVIMGLASVCTWVERKGSALIQDRIGANRAGAYTEADDFVHVLSPILPKPLRPLLRILFAPVALVTRWLGILGVINTLLCDAVKALFKEDFIPEGVPNLVHCLGPFMAVFPVFIAFALVPIAPDFAVGEYHIHPQLAPLDSGVLFILAMGSIAVYGVAFAGWTGNNKFSMLGGLRAASQMISYELAMGITFVTVILLYGTLDLYQMVEAQRHRWGIAQSPLAWLSFIILFIVGMAETKRGPFDLPEAESELAAGYFTEYSGMKFLIFWLGEFAEIALFALILTMLFFGGWYLPFVDYGRIKIGGEPIEGTWIFALIGHAILMTKVLIICVLQIVIRWTLPRFRYDQLMSLGWKGLLPLSMANLLGTAALNLAK